jgi:hypothetical protein
MIDPKADQLFIRADLEELTGNTAYFRLSKEMKDFLNICRKKHGEIEGIILTKEDDDDSGDYHWNIGFVLPESKV